MQADIPEATGEIALADIARRCGVTYSSANHAVLKLGVKPVRVFGGVRVFSEAQAAEIVKAIAEAATSRPTAPLPQVMA